MAESGDGSFLVEKSPLLVDCRLLLLVDRDCMPETNHVVYSHRAHQVDFAHHGIPETVVLDNGPQFSSVQYAQFAKTYGFIHLKSSPLHPQGNGEAERAVKTIKTLLNKADDPYVALLNY